MLLHLAAAPTPPSPPPSPLTPLSSLLPQIPSPPLPLPSPSTHTSLTYAEAPLGYRATMIRSRAASLLPLPAPSPPLLLPSTHRDDLHEADMPLPAAARQTGHTLAHRVDYGFIDTMDASIRAYKSRAMTAIGEDDRDLLRAHVSFLTREKRYFARWLLLMSVRLLMPVGFRELVRTAEAGPQDGPADAGSSC
ncbi:hypothetical protein Tco_0285120 [Tanacetum coccineum]